MSPDVARFRFAYPPLVTFCGAGFVGVAGEPSGLVTGGNFTGSRRGGVGIFGKGITSSS